MLIKPTNEIELQELTNQILLFIGDSGKIKVKLNGRLKWYHGRAFTDHYIRSGRRKIDISHKYMEKSSLKEIIETIIHEIAHFKYSKVRKLRKIFLKTHRINWELTKKHDHTKSFKRLVNKLENRFNKNYELSIYNQNT